MNRLSLFRPRLLPLVIIVAGLMLTIRVGGIWEDVRAGAFKVEAQTAKAQGSQAADPAATPAADAAPTPTAPPEPPADPAPADAAPADAAPAAPADMAPPGSAEPTPSGDPGSFTQNEIDVLQKLAERRDAIDAREKEIDAREALVQAAENKVVDHIAEMKGLKKVVEDLLAEYSQRKDEQTLRMVKVYENMKPKDAARIFDELDMVTSINMVESMKEVKFAAILAKMDPAKAKLLTTELTNRRQLPMPGADVGQ